MIFNIIAEIIVLIGGTACLKKRMDLIQTAVLIFTGIPTVISLISSSVIILISKKYINKIILIFICFFIIIHICISISGILNTNKVGWIEDKCVSLENLHLTEDNKYEYCINENINYLFNYKYLLLFIENKSNNEKFFIKISDKIKYYKEDKEDKEECFDFLSKLSKTNNPYIYCLSFDKNISNEYNIDSIMIDLENNIIKNTD